MSSNIGISSPSGVPGLTASVTVPSSPSTSILLTSHREQTLDQVLIFLAVFGSLAFVISVVAIWFIIGMKKKKKKKRYKWRQ